MKRPSPYSCDECKADKQPSNGWWLLWTQRASEKPGTVQEPSGSLMLTPWVQEYADGDGVKHICGETCALKAISKWMGESKTAAN